MHHNTLTDFRTPPPLGGPHYTRSLALLNCRSREPAPYIGPQTISRTFLIIPEDSATLYKRPFLDRSRQHENSREAARHFRNVPKCAVYRNYAITKWRNLNTLRTIPRHAGETQNIIRNSTYGFYLPAPWWASGFSTTCWGGGECLDTYRLLRIVEQYGKRRSKAR